MVNEKYVKGLEGYSWAVKCFIKGCENPIIGLNGIYCAQHRKEKILETKKKLREREEKIL